MKFVALSDVHLTAKNPMARLDDLVEVQMGKLKFVLDWAQNNSAIILQAGDFFNRPRSWTLLPRVMDLLSDYDNEIYCVYGQHDTYFYSETTREATSLGILEKAGYVNILSKTPIYFKNNIEIYGVNWGEEIPTPDKTMPMNILIIHAPISTGPLFPNHEYTSADRFLRKHTGYNLILCGDIHRKFIIQDGNRYLINTGPMLRLTAEQYSFEHSPAFAVYDTEEQTVEWVEIPHKDASEVLTRAHIENKVINSAMLDEFVDSLKDSFHIGGVDLKENIKKYIDENKISKDVREILSEVMAND